MKLKLKTCLGRYSKEKIEVYEKYRFEFDHDPVYDEYIIQGVPEVEVSSIEELIEIAKQFGNDLIISGNSEIKIYDGWIE